MEATPYRISTMTATGYVGVNVNLDAFFEHVPVTNTLTEYGITYAEFGSNKHNQIYKGTNTKKKYVRKDGKKEVSTKRFDNSVTIKYKTSDSSTLNIKIFKNGKIQMTGVKNEKMGRMAIDYVISVMKDMCKDNKLCFNDLPVVSNPDDMINDEFCIHLINSDFKVNIEIRRDFLYNLLMSDYKVICTYEPCIYPGVKIQYYYNEDNNADNIYEQGVCSCETPCDGKGKGLRGGKCKKITISIFQSGCILITGVTSITHIEIGYEFITNILKEHLDKIKRVKLELNSQMQSLTL